MCQEQCHKVRAQARMVYEAPGVLIKAEKVHLCNELKVWLRQFQECTSYRMSMTGSDGPMAMSGEMRK